MSYKKTISSN